jgi:hypothetical protein
VSPYRTAHATAERPAPTLRMRSLAWIAEAALTKRECENLRWYRRFVGGVWIKKTYVFGDDQWVRVDALLQLGLRDSRWIIGQELEDYR